ncbi:MAG TPA: hypothetical protein VFZ49_02080 [Pyrinomonadaceae bacterium]
MFAVTVGVSDVIGDVGRVGAAGLAGAVPCAGEGARTIFDEQGYALR